jgi:hypothetical protein
MQKYENERSAGGGVKASGGYGSTVSRVGASIGAGFRKQFLSSKIKESTLPNEVLIANASGTTNRAIWEFYRGDGIEAIGQYNLKIIFRLRESPQYEERFCYCADWNVEVNGRKLMAHVDDTNTKQDHECENYVQKDGVRYYRTIEPKMKQSLLQKLFSRKRTEKQDSITKRIVKLIQEDDPDIDKRLLRPLILLESSDKPPQSKNLKPSPSSWKTKIKNIDSCPSLVVEATVLSNPKKIEIQGNCKRDTRYIVTYLLLGDDTGVIVLIDEKLDKLNQCKMGDKVRVIGAEGKEVLYPDLGGVQRILKYRHTDLYVNKSTCIEKCEDKISTARSATR